MVRSGLIMGVVMFVLALGASAVISPLCAPCLAIFIGLGAGYLAGVFDKPAASEAIKKGTLAGAIVGGFALVGQIIAGMINASTMDPATINRLMEQMMGGSAPYQINQQTLWMAQLGGALCIGLFNVAILAGLGAAGAAIWRSTQGNKSVPPPPTYSPMQ